VSSCRGFGAIRTGITHNNRISTRKEDRQADKQTHRDRERETHTHALRARAHTHTHTYKQTCASHLEVDNAHVQGKLGLLGEEMEKAERKTRRKRVSE